MSEYIVRMPSDMPYEIKAELNAWYVNSEPIVRCKDCKYLCDDGSTWGCGWHCSCLTINDGTPPDGFCKWGERRKP